jgi:hypothetical protein
MVPESWTDAGESAFCSASAVTNVQLIQVGAVQNSVNIFGKALNIVNISLVSLDDARLRIMITDRRWSLTSLT